MSRGNNDNAAAAVCFNPFPTARHLRFPRRRRLTPGEVRRYCFNPFPSVNPAHVEAVERIIQHLARNARGEDERQGGMSNSAYKFRPSEIDRQLSARPELRDTAVAWATDYGVTVAELVKRLKGIGIKTSRAGASRWRLRMRPPHPGPIGKLERDVIAKVMKLSRPQLRELDRDLGRKLREK